MSYWDERDDDAELFRKRKNAVKTTWAIVGEELGVEATVTFYHRLFELHPEVKPMFSNFSEEGYDIYEQAEKLFNTLCVAVEFLNDVENLIPILQDLGKKHAMKWNVQRFHYEAVGGCLIWTLRTSLGDDVWTDDTEDAWVWVFNAISKTMSDAGDEVLEAKEKKNEDEPGRRSSWQKSMRASFSLDEEIDEIQNQENKKLEHDIIVPRDQTNAKSIRSQIRAGVTNRNEIELRPESTALLIIDIQVELCKVDHDSPHLAYAMEKFPSMIENIRKLISAMRSNQTELEESSQRGSDIIFAYCEALTDDSRDASLDYKLSGYALSNLPCPSKPAQFVDGIEPIPGRDIRMKKTSCSVFQSTNIDYVLRNLNVEQLIICGQATDQAVESACRNAADRGYLVTIPKDACFAQSGNDHVKGLHGMSGFSRQLSSNDVLRELRPF
mmetsp:Transcript_38099/g.85653  ORF Transcript_38099/g.85653 Transcript_38099/m.85653 type:complete len:440 (+) Transcript_38099:183-1502(+)